MLDWFQIVPQHVDTTTQFLQFKRRYHPDSKLRQHFNQISLYEI